MIEELATLMLVWLILQQIWVIAIIYMLHRIERRLK